MPDGILLLDKPLGLSSNAALQRVRRLFGRVKAGHVGSLDPLASGMLPVCLGEATKVAGDILAGRKCYRFTIALGTATATGDAEGVPVAHAAVPELAVEAVRALLARFEGEHTQIPPMYSALKKGGTPLYRLARAGVTVERSARTVTLHGLRLLELGADALELETVCSKGTYVRVLAEDIARALGTCGHVSALRRLYVEPFEGAAMATLGELEALPERARAGQLLPADRALQHLPAVTLDAEEVRRLRLGQALACEAAPAARVRVYAAGAFVGLGTIEAPGLLRPKRLIVSPPE